MTRSVLSLLLVLIFAVAAYSQPTSTRSSIIDSLLAYRDTNRPDRVDSLAGPAITAARAERDTTHLAHLLLIRGATRAGFGQARLAESDLREGAALAVAEADTLRHLQFLRWLGVAVGRQGRGAEATVLYTEVEELARAADDSLHLGWAWVGLAYGHYLQGRSVEAGELYARAAGVLERYGESAGATWAWNGLGLVLRQSGRYREARAAFANVLALSEATGDAINQAAALNFLGRLDMQLGDPGRAVDLFRRSAEIHRAHQHHREGLVPCIDMAAARVQQGRYVEAEAALDSILTVCGKLGLRDLELLAESQLVDAWMAQERPGAAAARCRKMLAGGEMPSRLSATETRLRLARALADRDSLAAAVSVLDDVLDEGAGAVSLELQGSGLLGGLLVDHGRPDAAEGILRRAVATARQAGSDADLVVLLTHLGRAEAALDRPDSALAIYSRAIACWERVRASPADPVWREHRGMVSGSLFAHAVAARLESPDGLPGAWDWAQRHKARTLQERMLGPGAETVKVTTPDLASFQNHVLRPGEVFLDVIEGEKLGILFCVTRDTALASRLPGHRSNAPRLHRLLDVVMSPTIDDAGPALRLAEDLVSAWPAETGRLAQGAEAVSWCPDGSWHRLPASLMNWSGTLTRVPAAGVLTRLRELPHNELDTALIMAVTGPDPEGEGPLPGAATETGWLASRFTNVRRPRTLDAIEDLWASADILHLATHTLLDAYQPWNSSVTLSRDSQGFLRAADIIGLDQRARLAVLAGCTTAGRQVVGGEGLIGLAGAFMAARTPAVLATLWPVDDAITFQMTTAFYDGLADGLSAAAALDRARFAGIESSVSGAPRHWAAFTLVGDGEVTVPVRRRAARWHWVLGLGALAVLAFRRARKRKPSSV